MRFFFGGVTAAFFLLGSANAYTVSGVVKSDSGSAVSGANVLLQSKGISAITDANGEFTLHEDEIPETIHSYASPSFLSVKGSVLTYSQNGSEPVQVQIFDLMGNKLLSTTLSGSGSVNLEGFVNARGNYFAKVKVGNAHQNFKFSASGQYNGIYSGARGKAILKKAGETDNLRVTADGYDTLTVYLSNLDTTLSLTLKKSVPAEQTYAFGYALKNAPRLSKGCGKDGTLTGRSYSCEKGSCDQTAQLFSINVDGTNRDYYVSFPKNYDKNKPYRIIFAMHCMGSSANHMATWVKRDRDHVSPFYALRALDTNSTTIFVAPQGESSGMWTKGAADHKFIDKLITYLEDSYCVDTTRVFATGFSFGAMFTNSLAQTFQHRLRGVAVYAVADYNIYLPANAGKPIAWMGVHGKKDGMCDYNKALTSALPRILKNNGPNGTDVSSEKPQEYPGYGNHVCYDFTKVDPRFPVRWCSHGADHQWSATDNGDNYKTWVPEDVWKFFGQF